MRRTCSRKYRTVSYGQVRLTVERDGDSGWRVSVLFENYNNCGYVLTVPCGVYALLDCLLTVGDWCGIIDDDDTWGSSDVSPWLRGMLGPACMTIGGEHSVYTARGASLGFRRVGASNASYVDGNCSASSYTPDSDSLCFRYGLPVNGRAGMVSRVTGAGIMPSNNRYPVGLFAPVNYGCFHQHQNRESIVTQKMFCLYPSIIRTNGLIALLDDDCAAGCLSASELNMALESLHISREQSQSA